MIFDGKPPKAGQCWSIPAEQSISAEVMTTLENLRVGGNIQGLPVLTSTGQAATLRQVGCVLVNVPLRIFSAGDSPRITQVLELQARIKFSLKKSFSIRYAGVRFLCACTGPLSSSIPLSNCSKNPDIIARGEQLLSQPGAFFSIKTDLHMHALYQQGLSSNNYAAQHRTIRTAFLALLAAAVCGSTGLLTRFGTSRSDEFGMMSAVAIPARARIGRVAIEDRQDTCDSNSY